MQREVRIVIGKTGSGKSSYAKALFSQLTRALVLDYRNEYPVTEFFDTFDGLYDYLTCGNHPIYRVGYCANEITFPLVCDLSRLLTSNWFFVEEIDRYFYTNSADEIPEFAELVARGRHSGSNIVGVSQFPFRIPIELRREASHIVAFHHHEPADLKWFRDVIGREYADELPGLGVLEGIEVKTDGTGARRFKIEYAGNAPQIIFEKDLTNAEPLS